MLFPRSLRLLYRATAAFMADVMRLYAVCWSWVGLLARSRVQVMLAAATCSWDAGAACGAAASAATTALLRQGKTVGLIEVSSCGGLGRRVGDDGGIRKWSRMSPCGPWNGENLSGGACTVRNTESNDRTRTQFR